MKEGGYNVSSHFNPQKGATMKIVLNFDEMSKILLEHVRLNMNSNANKVEIPSVYSHREDFCILTFDKTDEESNTNFLQV